MDTEGENVVGRENSTEKTETETGRACGVFLKQQRSEGLELSKHRREGAERSGKGCLQSHR